MNDITRYSREKMQPIHLSTDHVPSRFRHAWLVEEIGRHYAAVQITPPRDYELFNDMRIYSWGDQQFSAVESNPIRLERPHNSGKYLGSDLFFVSLLRKGRYRLVQDGKEAELNPGDMCLYDARRPHQIECPEQFAKVVIKIPGNTMRLRLPNAENYTAIRLSGQVGLGAIASELIGQTIRNIEFLDETEALQLGTHIIDLLAIAFRGSRRRNAEPLGSKHSSLATIKAYIEINLRRNNLSPRSVAKATQFSTRYINQLFRAEEQSLMQYIYARRIEHCQREFEETVSTDRTISDIAYSWGFNDPSHFSRVFKQQVGLSPREYREQFDKEQ